MKNSVQIHFKYKNRLQPWSMPEHTDFGLKPALYAGEQNLSFWGQPLASVMDDGRKYRIKF